MFSEISMKRKRQTKTVSYSLLLLLLLIMMFNAMLTLFDNILFVFFCILFCLLFLYYWSVRDAISCKSPVDEDSPERISNMPSVINDYPSKLPTSQARAKQVTRYVISTSMNKSKHLETLHIYTHSLYLWVHVCLHFNSSNTNSALKGGTIFCYCISDWKH